VLCELFTISLSLFLSVEGGWSGLQGAVERRATEEEWKLNQRDTPVWGRCNECQVQTNLIVCVLLSHDARPRPTTPRPSRPYSLPQGVNSLLQGAAANTLG